MITYNNLFNQVYTIENLKLAYKNAKKGKSKKIYVKNFEKNVEKNLNQLQSELLNKTYYPSNLNRFTIYDPKTRIIHSSIFRDRIVHHAIINILNPIYDKIFIYDSFASRKNKGTHKAVNRFEYFIRKVSNGRLIKNARNNNQIIGYCLKADFRKYFDTVNQEILIKIIEKKIKDTDLIDLIKLVLSNFEIEKGIGMPLGNYTSQFFANIYLNELDYYIKKTIGVKFYIRYVDDFIILHKDKRVLEYYLEHIKNFLPCLKIKLHPDKTEIIPLRNGITFLGYRVFYNFKLLRKRNIRYFRRKLHKNLEDYRNYLIDDKRLECKIQGWFGYAKFANTFNLRNKIIEEIKSYHYKSKT